MQVLPKGSTTFTEQSGAGAQTSRDTRAPRWRRDAPMKGAEVTKIYRRYRIAATAIDPKERNMLTTQGRRWRWLICARLLCPSMCFPPPGRRLAEVGADAWR